MKQEIIVAGIIRKKDKLLCVIQDKGPFKGFIWLPAGHLKLKESLEEGVIREVKEETGLEVKVNRLLMKIEFNRMMVHFYLCDVIGGEINPKGEIKKVFWLSFKEILKSEKVHPALYLTAALSIYQPEEFYKGIKK